MWLLDIQRDHHLVKTILIKIGLELNQRRKAVKQVYRMKYDGWKNKSSYLNSTIEKPITFLKNPAIDDKEVGKSSIDIVGVKSEQKKVWVPKIKKDLPLSKTEIKPICSIGLPKWQEKKL